MNISNPGTVLHSNKTPSKFIKHGSFNDPESHDTLKPLLITHVYIAPDYISYSGKIPSFTIYTQPKYELTDQINRMLTKYKLVEESDKREFDSRYTNDELLAFANNALRDRGIVDLNTLKLKKVYRLVDNWVGGMLFLYEKNFAEIIIRGSGVPYTFYAIAKYA